MHRFFRFLIVALTTMTTTLGLADESGYRLPPQDVVDIIAAPPEPAVSFSPDGKWLLLIGRNAMPGIEDLARRKLQLAGIRIDPAANGPFRVDYGRSLALRRRDDETIITLPLPKDARLASWSWSHNSRAFVYTLVTDRGSELWGATVDREATPRRLTDRLSTVLEGI